MSANHLSDAELLEKLNANPFLRERIGSYSWRSKTSRAT